MPLQAKQYALGTFHGLWEAAQDHFAATGGWPPQGGHKAIPHGQRVGPLGSLYCPQCGQERRMFMAEAYVGYRAFYPRPEGDVLHKAELYKGGCLHAVLLLWCVQCSTTFTAVLYDGPSGDSLCLLSSA